MGCYGLLRYPQFRSDVSCHCISEADIMQNSIADLFTANNEPAWKTKAVEKYLSHWEQVSGHNDIHLFIFTYGANITKYKAGTFAAFCRRNGRWKLPGRNLKTDAIDWASELQKVYSPAAKTAFDGLEECISIAENDAITSMGELYAKLESDLQSKLDERPIYFVPATTNIIVACEAFQAVDQMPFFERICAIRDDRIHKITTLFDSLKEKARRIRYACTLEHDVNYLRLGMEETYKSCIQITSDNCNTTVSVKTKRGKIRKVSGAHGMRVEVIRKRLTGERDGISILTDVLNKTKEVFLEDLEGWTASMKKALNDGKNFVLGNFNGRFTVPKVKSEDQEAMRTLQAAVKKALGIIEGEMKDHIERCKQHEAGGVLE
jgi:hypothetical protein